MPKLIWTSHQYILVEQVISLSGTIGIGRWFINFSTYQYFFKNLIFDVKLIAMKKNLHLLK
jgi:hypothetical protein